MFGKNAISKRIEGDGSTLLVNELFYTIQGEGPDAGKPAIFLRLAKCNLRCFFCDTEFEKFEERPLNLILEDIHKIRTSTNCKLVVITGGEPLLQNIIPLLKDLEAAQMCVTIETAGTVYLEGLDAFFKRSRAHAPNGNAIICSPKTGRLEPRLAKLIYALKYIINVHHIGFDGLPNRSTQNEGLPMDIARPSQVPHAHVYVQPMDVGEEAGNKANMNAAITTAMANGYRLSLQMHKIAGLP